MREQTQTVSKGTDVLKMGTFIPIGSCRTSDPTCTNNNAGKRQPHTGFREVRARRVAYELQLCGYGAVDYDEEDEKGGLTGRTSKAMLVV